MGCEGPWWEYIQDNMEVEEESWLDMEVQNGNWPEQTDYWLEVEVHEESKLDMLVEEESWVNMKAEDSWLDMKAQNDRWLDMGV